MWRVYRDDDPSRPVEPNENATPGMAPPPALGLDSIELLVDGECFVVSRRPASLGTYDFPLDFAPGVVRIRYPAGTRRGGQTKTS